MRELLSWVDRLHASVKAEDGTLAERLRKISAPVPVSMDNSIIRIAEVGNEIHSFGTAPSYLSILGWPEQSNRPEVLEDHVVGAQLGALLSLASDRRVLVAATDVVVGVHGTTNKMFIPAGLADRSLNGPLPSDLSLRFEDLLSLFVGLPEGDRGAVGSAIELHYAAVQLCDLDPNAAYALLVAGLEGLSSRFGDPPHDWELWEDAERFDATFEEIGLGADQAERLREELLRNRNLRLRQTFASYVTERLPADFWDLQVPEFTPQITLEQNGESHFTGFTESGSQPITAFVPRDAVTLRRRLLASYDRRSSYVHVGTRASPNEEVIQLIGSEPEPRTPLPFRGLRAILRALVLAELQSHAVSASLPPITMKNPEAT